MKHVPHCEDLQISRAVIQNLAIRIIWRPGLIHTWS